MKIAEALLLRADLKKKIDSMRERIKVNCSVQEGEVPHEDPQKLLADSFRLMQERERLIVQINEANVVIRLPSGKTMMQGLAERERLMAQHSMLKEAAASSQKSNEYYSNREIKWKAVMNVAGLEKQADDLSKKVRELNTEIQSTNWTAELPEA
jgi:hypothetical protein